MNAAQNNYRLLAGSPGIDVGLNSAPGLLPTDLVGLPRIVDGSGKETFIIDMGAYVFQPVTALPTSIDFGTQILDSHASRNVTLTNHQTGALSVSVDDHRWRRLHSNQFLSIPSAGRHELHDYGYLHAGGRWSHHRHAHH